MLRHEEKEEDLYVLNLKAAGESIFDNVIIDPHSLELLKIGAPKQRYAVVGWLDEEKNQVHLHFRPSFVEDRAEPERKKYNPIDIVEAPPGVTGIVHQRVIHSVQQYFLAKEKKEIMFSSPSYFHRSKRIGLSFYKKSDHVLSWTNRSTLNAETFSVNPLAMYCLYFSSSQHYFTRPRYTQALHTQRSLKRDPTFKIASHVQHILLGSPSITELSLEEKAEIAKNCYDFKFEQLWETIKKDKQLIAKNLMRTIYIASGLKPAEEESSWPQDENWVVIQNVLKVAEAHEIKLDLESYPAEFKTVQATALVMAVVMGDLRSVRLLAEAGANIEAKDGYGNTALLLAANHGHFAKAQWLIAKGAVKTAKNQKGHGFIEHLSWGIAALAEKECFTDIALILNEYKEINLNLPNPYMHYKKPTYVLFEKFLQLAGHGSLDKIQELKAVIPCELFQSFFQKIEESGEPVLLEAAYYGHLSTIQWLITEGASTTIKDDYGHGFDEYLSWGVASLAIKEDFAGIASILREYKEIKLNIPNPNKSERTAESVLFEKFLELAKQGSLDKMKELKDAMPQLFYQFINKNNGGIFESKTAISLAAESQQIDMVYWLAEQGAHVKYLPDSFPSSDEKTINQIKRCRAIFTEIKFEGNSESPRFAAIHRLCTLSKEKKIKFSYLLNIFQQIDMLNHALNEVMEIKELNNLTNQAYQNFARVAEEKEIEIVLEQLLKNVEDVAKIMQKSAFRAIDSPSAISALWSKLSPPPLKRLENLIKNAREFQNQSRQCFSKSVGK